MPFFLLDSLHPQQIGFGEGPSRTHLRIFQHIHKLAFHLSFGLRALTTALEMTSGRRLIQFRDIWQHILRRLDAPRKVLSSPIRLPSGQP